MAVEVLPIFVGKNTFQREDLMVEMAEEVDT
jgi:hypothetical protein